MARSPVALLDGVISHLAHLADNRAIDYRFIVVFSTWLQTAFEVYIL